MTAAWIGVSYGTLYIVQPWEILGSIAEALGSSMDDLVRYDRIRNPDLILASERLRIPNPNIVWHSLAANFC